MSHRFLADLLISFSENGPGNVPLIVAPTGTQIPDGRFIMIVRPTWENANNWLTLPPPVPGRIVMIAGAATGGELRTSNPATIGINGGVGANAESAVAANQMVIAICESATNWKAFTIAGNGTVAGLEVAAP